MVWPLTESAKLIEASPIKNWTSNEQISYYDLNNNFNHLHANLGHGHGPIITANDIASNAGIRPEQTTFGLSSNRSQVFEGTFKINPDAGLAYLPINYNGTLAVSIARTAEGYTITGGSQSGALTDAGTSVYTVITQALGTGYTPTAGATTNRFMLCWSIDNGPTFSSPLSIVSRCQDLGTAITTPTPVNPQFVSVEVYNNKVQ